MEGGGRGSLNTLISPMDLLMSPLSEEEEEEEECRLSTEFEWQTASEWESGTECLRVHLKEEETGRLCVLPQLSEDVDEKWGFICSLLLSLILNTTIRTVWDEYNKGYRLDFGEAQSSLRRALI